MRFSCKQSFANGNLLSFTPKHTFETKNRLLLKSFDVDIDKKLKRLSENENQIFPDSTDYRKKCYEKIRTFKIVFLFFLIPLNESFFSIPLIASVFEIP